MTEHMRAVRVHELGAVENGRLERTPVPEPGDHDVLVEIAAAPVNLVDIVTITGKYQFNPDTPYTPGKGPAGYVRAVGSQVKNVTVGDRVLAMCEKGGYAQFAVAPARDVYALPDAVSFEAAAAMSIAYETAYLALTERAQLQEGESVLVLGASSAVGTAALQIARALGADVVLAGVRDLGVGDNLREQGATDLVSLAGHDLRESVRRDVLPLTDGRGVDVLIDMVGGDAFDGAIRAVAWRGRAVIVGFASGRIPTLKMNYPLLKNLAVSGLQISDYRHRAPEITRQGIHHIFELYSEGKIAAPTTRVFPLEDWQTAMAGVRDRTYGMDRILIVPERT